MAAALISTIAIATADLIVAKITAVVYFFKEILNAVRSVFMLFFTNPILFLAIVFVLVGSIFWLPYHHIGFEVIQIVHTDIVRPLARDVLHPAVAAIAPVYEDIASWINFLYFTFRRFLFDMLILPLRCARLPEFVRALINSVLPFARFVVIVARMSGRALLGQSVPNEMPAVAVGLLFDDIANVTDATGGITDCYCAAVSYYFDFGVLLFRDRDIQCSFANMLGFAQEFLARSIRFLISILYYLSTVLKWLLCLFFSGLSSGACVPGEFPFPNATQLLPNIDILLDRTEAAACCGGDAIDNIVNTAVDTAVDIANTIGLHPLDKNITPPGFWKVSAPIKALVPHYLETLRVYYGVSKAFIDLSFDFSAVNFTRLDATDAQMCMTLAEGAQSFQHPLVTHALSAAAGAVTSPFLAGPQAIAGFIYGPEFVNHSCMAYVLITRSFTDAIQYTGSYDDFKTGKFFDCFLSEVRLASEAAEAGVLELFDIIPMWRSCRVLPTRYDPVTGMPELMGYPRIQCDDSAFHEELSQTLAAPVRIMSAYFDYAATLSENLDSFDAARRVSTGCIFDEYSRAINASAHLLAVAIDQIPQSVPDGQFMVEFDGNLTEEIVRWIFPRVEGLFGGDDENITEDLANFIDDVEQAIVDALDEIPYANSIVNDPYLGPRPFGLGDVFPPVAFSIRSLPPLLGSLGVMFVETLRFVAETVHAGDFEHWDFDPDNLERLLRAQIDFTNALSSSAVSQLCLIKNLTSGVDSHGNPVFRDDTNCTARVHWDALNFTLCPLDFIPCAEPTLSKILSATVRVADMIPQLVLYSDDFIDKVFDPALCDLETAAYELDEILGAWNISADLPYWKTSLRLDISLVTSSGKYAGLKLLGVVNKILIEVLNGFVRNDFSASSGCTRDNPSWNGATCVKCYDIAEPTARCAAGFECCGGSGRCLERCFDGNGIMESVTDAAEALVGFTDALSLPLKVIDPMAHDVGEASGRSLAYMMQSLFEFIFARSELPPRAYGDVLPEFTCVSDELSVALGKLQGVGISVAGRFVSAVAELAGNENFAEAALENPQELANATSYLVNASGRVASETVGALLHLVGTVLDGAEYSSFEDWFLAATSYKCRVTNAFAEIPAAAGDVVRALDVTGHNAFCEPASLIQKLLRLVQDAILQSISLLNSLPRSPYLGKGLNIAQIFKTMRQILVEIGNVISYLLYAVFSVVIDNDTQLDKLANFFEGVGFFVAAILNLALSFLETIANFLVSVLDKFGIDSIICGASSTGDTYDIIAPMLKAVSIFLESIANLLGVVNEKLGDAAHAIVTLIDTFVLERDSLFAKLVVGALNLFFAVIDLLVGIISGDIGNAAEDFANAILDFIDLILDTIVDVLVTFVDDFIFGGTGVMACLVDLIDCIGDLVGDIVDSLFSWGPAPPPEEEGKTEILRARATTQMVGALAYIFPETDSCRATLKRVAQLYVGREEGKDLFASLPWWQRWIMNTRTVGCMYRLENQQYLQAYLDRNSTSDTELPGLPRDGFGASDNQNLAKFVGEAEDYALHDALSKDAVCRREYYGDESGAGFFGSDSDPVCQIDAAVRVASRIRNVFDAIVAASSEINGEKTRDINFKHAGAHSRQIARLGKTFSELAGGVTETAYGLLLRSLLDANGGDIDKTAETIGRVQDIADSLFGIAWTTADAQGEIKISKDADADGDFAALLWYLSGGDPAHQKEYGISVAIDAAPRFGDANFSADDDYIILPRGFSDGDWLTQGTDYSGYQRDTCGHIIADAFDVMDSGPIRPRRCPRTCPNCTNPESIISVQKICPIESCPDIMNDYPETLGMCARACSGPQQSSVFRSSCRRKYLNGYGPIGYHPEVWVLASLSALTELSLRGMTAFKVAVLERLDYTMTTEFKNMVFDEDFNVTEYSGGSTQRTSDGDLTTGDVCTDVGRYGRPSVNFCNAKCNTGNPGSLYYRMTDRYGDLFDYGPNPPFGHEAYVNLLTQVCSAYCKPYDRTCAAAPRNMECTSGGALSIATCLRTCKLQWIPSDLDSWNSSSGSAFVLPGFDPIDTFLPPCRPHSYDCNPLPKLFGNKTYPIARSCQCPPLWAGNETEIADICACSYEQAKRGNRVSPSTSSWVDFGCPLTFRNLQYTWHTDLDYVAETLPMRPEIERIVTDNVTHTFYDIGDLSQWSWDENKTFDGAEYSPLLKYPSVNVVEPQIIGTQCNDTETIISLSFSSNDTLCADPLQICQIYEECREFIIPQTQAIHRLDNIEVEMTLDAQWLYPVDATIGNSTESECVWTDVVGLCDSRFCDSTATYLSPSPSGTCMAERHCARGWWCPQSFGCDVSGLAWLNTTYLGNFSFHHRYDFISPFTHQHVFVCRNVTRCTVNGTLATCYNVSVESPVVNIAQHSDATCVNVTETAGGFPAQLGFNVIWGIHTEGVAFPVTFVGEVSTCDNPLVHTGDLCSYLCEDETGLEQDCYSLFRDVGLDCEILRNDTLYPKNATFGAPAARRWFCENIVPDFTYVDITAFPLAGRGMITPTWVDKIAAYSPSADATSCVNGGQLACVMKAPTAIPDPIKTRLTDEECQLIRTLLEATYIPQIDDFSYQLYAAADPDERIDYPSLSLPSRLDWDPNVGRLDFVQVCNYVGCEQGIGEATGVDENQPRSAPSENSRRRQEQRQMADEDSREEERKCAKLGTINLKMVNEVERIREAAGEISDVEWIAILHARYGSPENFKDEDEILPSPTMTIEEENEEFSARRKRARDAEMIGRAILESSSSSSRKNSRATQKSTRDTEIYEPPEDYCEEPSEECPQKICDLGLQYPAPCNRYPLPGTFPPCERREYECEGFAAEDPCATWLAEYLVISDDPMGKYEEIFGEEVPLPEEQPTVEDLLVRIDDIRKMISDFFANSMIGKSQTASAAWSAASGHAKLTLEAMTCASMPWSAACGRIERAIVRQDQITRRQARAAVQTWTRTLSTPIANMYDAAVFAREAIEWLPPPDSLSRSCYLLCGYDYMHLFQRSCLRQADGENGPVTQFLQSVIDIFGDLCEYADLENGTDLLRPLSAIIPDFTKINTERSPSNASTGATTTWGGGSTLVAKMKIIISKIIGMIFGVPIDPALAPGDIAFSIAASILGYDNSTAFMDAVREFALNTNIDPESGDVGAAFWALFLSPVGANCASVNGTYRIADIPIYSPFWFPALPIWLGNTTLSVVDFFAKLEWVVPESMVVDADECYYDQEICEPLTENCPCSPKFENCGDRIGFVSPLDTIYFGLNWWIPNAPNMRLFRTIAMFTFTTPWLDKFANVTTSSVFYDDLFCFIFVGIPSSLWYLVFLGVILALGVMAFLLGMAWLKFIALMTLAFAAFLLFYPVQQEIVYLVA